MEEGYSGLGFGGLGFDNVVVVDPRYAAGRGDQFTNAFQEDMLRKGRDGWEDFREPGEEDAGPPPPMIDLNTEIPDSNVGFKMLQKMGWSKGKGLGAKEDGIREPVRAGVDAGVRLGLGKQSEDDHYTNAELIERRRMESEIQATEDEDRKKKREAQAERDQKIREEVTEIKKTFYCEVCHKQYEKAMEYEQHLDSYDHHHKKRLQEMRAMQSGRTKDERARKEAKAVEKEMAKLQQQIHRAKEQQQGRTGTTAAPPPLPPGPPPPPTHNMQQGWGNAPPLPDEPPPPPPPASNSQQQQAGQSVGLPAPAVPGIPLGTGMSISFGGGRGAGLQGRGSGPGRPGAAGRGRQGGAVAGRGLLAGRGAVGQVLSGFGCSSSDDEAAG